MTRSKNVIKTKSVVEMGHELNNVITIDTIKFIFQEMFQQQEKETVNLTSLVNNQRTDKLSSDININNEKLIKLANDISDVQLCIEASQKMIENKSKKLKRELIKNKNIGHYEEIKDGNKRLKDELRELQYRSRRDNLRFDWVREYENES